MVGGDAIIAAGKTVSETVALAHAAEEIVSKSGRACKQAVLGVMATKSDKGMVSNKRVRDLTGVSRSYIYTQHKWIHHCSIGNRAGRCT